MSRREEHLEDKFAQNAVKFGKDEYKDNSTHMFGGLANLKSVEDHKKAVEEANKPKGLIERKLNRIFGAASDVKTMFFTGFKTGFIVGGIFGSLVGTYYAITTRSLMALPFVAISTGSSFGFFMGIGMIMRNELEGNDEEKSTFSSPQFMVFELEKESKEFKCVPIYQQFRV